jgi:hypothetical protein
MHIFNYIINIIEQYYLYFSISHSIAIFLSLYFSIIITMEQIENQLQFLSIDTNPAIFTRYLYIKQNVYWSLLCAIIHKRTEEALFWGYELYYSGFENELMHYLIFIYNSFFLSTTSNSYKDIMLNKLNLWFKTKYHVIVGTIIFNLCNKKADAYSFLERNGKDLILKDEIEDDTSNINSHKNLFININENSVEKYKTIISDSLWKTLQEISIYSTLKVTNNTIDYLKNEYLLSMITPIYEKEKLLYIFRYEWEVYAYRTPIWKSRIDELGGTFINKNDIYKLSFSSDDIHEKYYELYGYEPEEQPVSFFENRL